jgi:hypothetical protein
MSAPSFCPKVVKIAHIGHHLRLLTWLQTNGLSEEHIQLREAVFNFAQKELAPHAQAIDKENNFSDLRAFWRKLVHWSHSTLTTFELTTTTPAL